MPSRGFRPLLTSWLARKPRSEATPREAAPSDAMLHELADWVCVEDATSRWLRATQGAELG